MNSNIELGYQCTAKKSGAHLGISALIGRTKLQLKQS